TALSLADARPLDLREERPLALSAHRPRARGARRFAAAGVECGAEGIHGSARARGRRHLDRGAPHSQAGLIAVTLIGTFRRTFRHTFSCKSRIVAELVNASSSLSSGRPRS